MLTLAIDTAAEACAACLHDGEGDRVMSAISENIGRGHAERLMAVIDACLAEAGVKIGAVSRIGVTVGPGSFTGIRVGVSVARGLALALKCPVIGISTLEAIGVVSASSGQRPVLVAIDAKRGEVYAQLFGPDGGAMSDAAAMAPRTAAVLAMGAGAALAGSGAPIVEATADVLDILSDAATVDISAVARIAASRRPPFKSPKPLYLRGADARPQTGFAVARKPVAAQ